MRKFAAMMVSAGAVLSGAADAQASKAELILLTLNPRAQRAEVLLQMDNGFPIGSAEYAATIDCATGATKVSATEKTSDKAGAVKNLLASKALQAGNGALTLTIKNQTFSSSGILDFDGSVRLYCKDKILYLDGSKLNILEQDIGYSRSNFQIGMSAITGRYHWSLPLSEDSSFNFSFSEKEGAYYGLSVFGVDAVKGSYFMYDGTKNQLIPLRHNGENYGGRQEIATAMDNNYDKTDSIMIYQTMDYKNPNGVWWKTTYNGEKKLLWTVRTTMPKGAKIGK